MKRILLLFLVVSAIFTNLSSQYSRGELKNQFYSSESFVLFEEYQEALPGYELNLRVDPSNYNLRYRIGQCLLNIPGRKQEAISFLEAAVREVSTKYREGKFTEKRAPYDAYYYLANAYRINNQLDKAIATYELFKKNLDPKVYDIEVVDNQIESCRNAIEVMKTPSYMKKTNLGDVINDRLNDINPVISGDETVMVYNRTGGFQDALFYTRKVNGQWSQPVNIIPDLGLGFEEGNFATSLSKDGNELYVYRSGDDYDGNIYVTRRAGDRWSTLEKLNSNINTKFWESHATISHDGRKLFFTSNRKGTLGGLDIYVSEIDSTGNWGPAENLGASINTRYNEETPFLGEDDKTLFFSSRGHFNIGGHDIFYSTLDDNGNWTMPLNIGYPLNSTDDDLFFNPTQEGYTAYFSILDSSGFGLADIYYIEIFSNDHPRRFIIRGIAQVKDLLKNFRDSIKVSALNIKDPDARVIVYTDPVTGEYKFELPQGNYTIAYEAQGAEKLKKDLELRLDHPVDSLTLPPIELPRTDFVADMSVESNQKISVSSGDTISIPVRVEPGSILTVEHWLNDSLINTGKFLISKPDFVYKFAPSVGINRLVFSLEDRFGNKTTSEIFITREQVVTQQPVVRPEYRRVIAEKQIEAFTNMLEKRADEKLSRTIQRSDITKKEFAKVDDVLAYLKEEALKNDLDQSEVDKLALRVAVEDNVLSQAAIDLLAANADGLLKEILDGLNMYDAGLKTWNDLKDYVYQKSDGKISPEDLDRLAAEILAEYDPGIEKIRNSILEYSRNYDKGKAVSDAVAATDALKIRTSGEWLKTFFHESLKLGLSESDLAGILKAISSLSEEKTEDFLRELIKYSEKSVAEYLGEISLVKNRIKTPEDLILHLIKGRDLGFFSEDILFRSLSKMIIGRDIPSDMIAAQAGAGGGKRTVALWIILGAGLIIIFIIFWRRKKKKDADSDL